MIKNAKYTLYFMDKKKKSYAPENTVDLIVFYI